MKMIVHDLSEEEFLSLGHNPSKEIMIISDNGKIHNCIGCYGCWIKTPGICVMKDGYQNMGALLSKCDELTIISKCIYGSYSPFIRNIWDRSMSYLLPYFVTKKGETHHRNRYAHQFSLSVHFYGDDITEAEMATARKLVVANSKNFYSIGNMVYFHKDLQAVGEALN
ncbi:MAG: flavodoxin family protein [Bacillota bacterium]|nr:flavodoxin family protein [Bacillota bacterium]